PRPARRQGRPGRLSRQAPRRRRPGDRGPAAVGVAFFRVSLVLSLPRRIAHRGFASHTPRGRSAGMQWKRVHLGPNVLRWLLPLGLGLLAAGLFLTTRDLQAYSRSP